MAKENRQKVAILMATYDGERFLQEQIDSIRAQDIDADIDLWVSDDGSTDNTLNTLRENQLHWERGAFHILHGPKNGFVANFLSLVCNPDIDVDYYAYSDQDDIWYKDKLSRAKRVIDSYSSNSPTLYCSRTRTVDEQGHEIGLSPLFKRPPSFRNALIQSIAGSNTMVMNRETISLLRAAGMQDIASHDWWTYLLVTGANGNVYYDAEPCIRYRQHVENIIGANQGFRASMSRIYQMLGRNRFKNWNSQNATALNTSSHLLTPENAEIFKSFSAYRKHSLAKRFRMLSDLHLYRHTLMGNIGFVVAILFNKV